MRFARRALTSLGAGLVLLGASSSSGQLPLEPLKETGQGVTAAYEGWFRNSDGSHSLLIGYFNRNMKETLEIPVGPNNLIEPGGPDRGQPTHFLPRRQWGVFTINVPADFGKNKLTWTLIANGQKTVVPFHLDPLWVVNPFEEPAVKNTPPSIKFEPAGVALTGPPRGVARSYEAKVSEPISLSAWLLDDAHVEEGPGGRSMPRLTIFWSKYRGPGSVTFSAPRPDVADGKATTTATFGVPGEYLLRAQVNDSSGDGGGGSQCCWTNAHVKVTVKPAGEGR